MAFDIINYKKANDALSCKCLSLAFQCAFTSLYIVMNS